jgi:hypothetical protein
LRKFISPREPRGEEGHVGSNGLSNKLPDELCWCRLRLVGALTPDPPTLAGEYEVEKFKGTVSARSREGEGGHLSICLWSPDTL